MEEKIKNTLTILLDVITYQTDINFLPVEEIVEVTNASNADEIFIGCRNLNWFEEKVPEIIFYKGNGNVITVPYSWFDSKLKSDYDLVFQITDFGHSVTVCNNDCHKPNYLQISTHSILREFDEDYKNKYYKENIQCQIN